MSELRRCPLTGDTLVIAPGRLGIGASRPGGPPAIDRARCPFCPGHEADTEPSVIELGAPWAVRVVENKYPIASSHEVVIESRDHDADLATFEIGHAALVLRAIRDRARALAGRQGIAAISTFRNRGRRAGSSQPHPHTQIVGLPFVPAEVARRAEIALRDPQALAAAIEREREHGARILADRDGFITFCPEASRRAWEVRVAPIFACERFSDLEDAQLRALASHLLDALARLSRVLGEPDYNVVVRDPPLAARRAYFVIDVLPRTGGDAGFELQTGSSVCVVDPDEAARRLRSVREEPTRGTRA